jgi:hypothetical protein
MSLFQPSVLKKYLSQQDTDRPSGHANLAILES